MGLPVDRTIFSVYVIRAAMAGLAGVILASQFGAGQPIEGVGWELFAIASVVVGGTLLTGGNGSVGGTLAGALLLGIIFTILNFENGMGWISLSAYWQSVVRGAVPVRGGGAAGQTVKAGESVITKKANAACQMFRKMLKHSTVTASLD